MTKRYSGPTAKDREARQARKGQDREAAIDRLMALLNMRLGNRKFHRDEIYDRKAPEPKVK